MKFELKLLNIQHIKELNFSIDLSKNQLMCIVGKNGVGKTTLIRAIKNLISADTFSKTASPYIFSENSRIIYTFDKIEYDFKYNVKIKSIDIKGSIDSQTIKDIYVELPLPHGERFGHFQKLGNIDEELRTKISLKAYDKPVELINFLSKIYNSTHFNSLKEVSIKGSKYYFLLKKNHFYIREDYLSSGEYFVINLYKMIQKKCKLIVVDEIDISLDASAQVNLIKELKQFCLYYEVNIVFTTHSLALMKTLSDSELFYMENENSCVSLNNKSYNHVKSLLFGFKGWDKYILTEDNMLEKYLTYLLEQDGTPIFSEYKIIYIAGGRNVIDLMDRNNTEHFFSSPDNVVCILDGDQKNNEYCKYNDKVFFIPFESVEKQLAIHYKNNDLNFEVEVIGKPNRFHKNLYRLIKRNSIMSDIEIFSFINERKQDEVNVFKNKVIDFLGEMFVK